MPETRTASKKVVLVVIDGLTATMFESTAERKTPALAYLAERIGLSLADFFDRVAERLD